MAQKVIKRVPNIKFKPDEMQLYIIAKIIAKPQNTRCKQILPEMGKT
jgi:hypothetical protein